VGFRAQDGSDEVFIIKHRIAAVDKCARSGNCIVGNDITRPAGLFGNDPSLEAEQLEGKRGSECNSVVCWCCERIQENSPLLVIRYMHPSKGITGNPNVISNIRKSCRIRR